MPTKEGISRSATEYNLVAEKAGNEMLLLNIVRASKRRPMYFTSFGKLTGSMTFAIGTGGINIPFGKIGTGLNGSYSIAPTAGYTNSPLFDVAVLDTQEFTRGIMTPVPMTTIGYYRSQGWPKEMLLHLFIRRIDIRDQEGKVLEEYVNYPGDPDLFVEFQKEIKKWDIVQVDNVTKIGEVDANEASKMQNLIEVQKAGLTLRPGKTKDKTELYSSQPTFAITLQKKGREVPFDELRGTIYFRSPHAMLYYLGEIVRAENKTGNANIAMINISHDPSATSSARLFYAREATNNDIAPCVSVDYEGTKYVIPEAPDTEKGCRGDRSMQVLSLVSQLIGLQKKSGEVPATGVVSVIGR
jgi:hypothetical protein